jgi:hypothetical protein
MNNPLLEKYKNFINLIVLDTLKQSNFELYSNITNIEITEFDVNEHTGKYYPHFLITTNSKTPYSLFLKESIAEKIRKETEKFFPDTFNIGQAWIQFKN